MRKGGLLSWQRMVDNDARDKKLALARARQLVMRCEQVEAALLGERTRRDQEERQLREAGDLPHFGRERLAALLERAIERAQEKVAAARLAESRTLDALRESWKRATAVERLLDRRQKRERLDALKAEQKELDEIASRRSGATLTEVGR
ncbi:MAG: hypothetical protein EXS13_07100 [Planctomycetes bacterium]|nr:hypothetical protein [Planctomycetota bacterium]